MGYGAMPCRPRTVFLTLALVSAAVFFVGYPFAQTFVSPPLVQEPFSPTILETAFLPSAEIESCAASDTVDFVVATLLEETSSSEVAIGALFLVNHNLEIPELISTTIVYKENDDFIADTFVLYPPGVKARYYYFHFQEKNSENIERDFFDEFGRGRGEPTERMYEAIEYFGSSSEELLACEPWLPIYQPVE